MYFLIGFILCVLNLGLSTTQAQTLVEATALTSNSKSSSVTDPEEKPTKSPISANTLIGSWVLKGFQCEDGSTIPEDQPDNPFVALKTPPTKTFGHKNQFQDRILIPLGRDVTCTTEGKGFYIVDENVLVIFLDELHSPDCPALVTGFNAQLEDNNLFEYEFKMIRDDQLVLLQPLENGETDFRCGKSTRVAEVWEKL